jgi:hypothetical protein
MQGRPAASRSHLVCCVSQQQLHDALLLISRIRQALCDPAQQQQRLLDVTNSNGCPGMCQIEAPGQHTLCVL